MGADNEGAVYKRRFNRLAMAVNCEYYDVLDSCQVQEDKRWVCHTP
jgi:hypothetical protein